jgi:hypothetical protein
MLNVLVFPWYTVHVNKTSYNNNFIDTHDFKFANTD